MSRASVLNSSLPKNSHLAARNLRAAKTLVLQAQTPEARAYAVKELARRAGVSREFFLTWTIESTNHRTTISLPSSGSGRIHFECPPEELLDRIASGDFPVARASCFREPNGALADPDLVVPGSDLPVDPSRPLFQAQEDGSFVCEAFLLLSIIFTLSRVEESISENRDEHGRFPGSASLAANYGFLERPIVDEYGLAFAQVLAALLPSWGPEPRSLKIKLSHDIDSVGIPLRARSAIGHTLKRKRPLSTVRDLLAPLTAIEPTELALVRRLGEISMSRGLHSSFYWKASIRTLMDDGYDPFDSKVQGVIRDLKEQGFEMGVHPAYDTFGSRSGLRDEIDRLRKALPDEILGGRQHYLRWSPQTWLDWEACGLAYDSTVGFADRMGFRAGTSIPFCPWCLSQNRELELIEIPLLLMDCTPVKYMGLTQTEAIDRIRLCVQRTARVGGVFTLLWHNVPLMEPEYAGWYEPILDLLLGGQPFMLPASPTALW